MLNMTMLTFTPDEKRKCFSVEATDDDTVEDSEQLELILSSPVPHIPGSTTVEITDNDSEVSLKVYYCSKCCKKVQNNFCLLLHRCCSSF